MLRVLVSFGMSTTDHKRNMPSYTGWAKSTMGTGNFNLRSCQHRKMSPLSTQMHIFVTEETNEGVNLYPPPSYAYATDHEVISQCFQFVHH